MRSLNIKRATEEDVEFFVETRIEVLATVFGEPTNIERLELERTSRAYFNDNKNHVTYFAFIDGEFAACGSICFYQVMPVCDNPTGWKGFIMNMYTRPDHRRQGISSSILDSLVVEARERGVNTIHLDASDIGKHLYTKYGFVESQSEMHLPA